MNAGSVFVLILVLLVVALVIRSMLRDRRKGISCACGLPEGACGLCAKKNACPSCGGCGQTRKGNA